MLFDGVANELANVDFFPFWSCDYLTGSQHSITIFDDGAIIGKGQVKNIAVSVSGAFL